MSRLFPVAAAVTPLALLVLLWQWLVPAGSKSAFLLSRPAEIVQTAFALAGTPAFWTDLAASAQVLAIGYLLGMVIGFAIGLSVWAAGKAGNIVERYLVGLGSVPIFAIAPLLIFVIGIGMGTRVFIVTLSVMVPVALAAASAAEETERRYLDLLRAYGDTRWRKLRLVIAPGAFYASLPTLKPAANAALVAVFLSEWISAQNGLAKFVLASMSIYNVAQMWVGLLTFVLLGVAFGNLVDLLERWLTHWRNP